MLNLQLEALESNIELGKAILIINNNGDFNFGIDFNKINSEKFDIESLKTMRRGEAVMAYSLFKMYEKGLKIFKITNLDFTALEQMNLSLTMDDYNQPYECMTIIPPKEYRENKVLGNKKINFVAVIFVNNFIIITVVYENQTTNTTVIQDCERLIEETFDEGRIGKGWNSVENRTIQQDEVQYLRGICKACLNAVLIIDEVGQKGLKSTVRKGQKKGTRETIYEFEQHVQIYEKSPNLIADPRSPTGTWTVKPHWRKGHWRVQRIGHNRADKKRIRIKPILVNKEFFSGDLSKTTVEYSK